MLNDISIPYPICRQSKNKKNKIFCVNSYPHICDIYCSNCKSINHNLVDLEQYLHEIN